MDATAVDQIHLNFNQSGLLALNVAIGLMIYGMALVLIFQFFGGLGGMAIIAGWWGVWHIISGLAMVFFWSHRSIDAAVQG